jgi:hypothetical protein
MVANCYFYVKRFIKIPIFVWYSGAIGRVLSFAGKFPGHAVIANTWGYWENPTTLRAAKYRLT